MMSDPRPKSRITCEEFVHTLAITGQDDDQIRALIFHHLQKNFYGFLTVIALVVRTMQIVSFVDEQHAPHRLFQYLLRFGRGVSNVLPNQIVPSHRDNVTTSHEPKPMQDIRHPQRNCRLASSRISSE